MAGVNSATLITKISEKITLNGNKYNNVVEKRINGIKSIFKRVISLTAGELTTTTTNNATVAIFKDSVSSAGTSATNNADGALDRQNVKYIRITNLDDENPLGVMLEIVKAEDDSAADNHVEMTVDAGMSFIFSSPDDGIYVNDSSMTQYGLGARDDIESIILDPGVNNIDAEVFIASI